MRKTVLRLKIFHLSSRTLTLLFATLLITIGTQLASHADTSQFAIGTVISTYLDSAKTALIVVFTVWVFAVLITPRVGFLAAKEQLLSSR